MLTISSAGYPLERLSGKNQETCNLRNFRKVIESEFQRNVPYFPIFYGLKNAVWPSIDALLIHYFTYFQ